MYHRLAIKKKSIRAMKNITEIQSTVSATEDHGARFVIIISKPSLVRGMLKAREDDPSWGSRSYHSSISWWDT